MKTDGNGTKQKLRVQYGCGFHAPAGWRNFDASPTLRAERVPLFGKFVSKNKNRFPMNVEFGDIVAGLPLGPDSCEAIYASHILEHLSLTDFQTALRNTFTVLAPGGYFRLVVPDLRIMARNYLSSSAATAAKTFMAESSLGYVERQRGLAGLLKLWLGNGSHLWMWDFEALVPELEDARFVEIRRCEFGDNVLFKDVEQQERFNECVGVECRKP